MIFDINQLEEMLGRKLDKKERSSIVEYSYFIQHPKPRKGDENYTGFIECRRGVFSLYKEAGEKQGLDTSKIDRILEEK